MYKALILIFAMISVSVSGQTFTQGRVIETLPDVLSFKERVKPLNAMVEDRLNHLLPALMKDANLDMWLVINREYGEDRLFYTLVPQPTFAARRTTILVFSKREDGTVERFSVSRYPIGELYMTITKDENTFSS